MKVYFIRYPGEGESPDSLIEVGQHDSIPHLDGLQYVAAAFNFGGALATAKAITSELKNISN